MNFEISPSTRRTLLFLVVTVVVAVVFSRLAEAKKYRHPHPKPSLASASPVPAQRSSPAPAPAPVASSKKSAGTESELAALEARSSYLASQISQLQEQQRYYLDKARSLNQRSTTRSPNYYPNYGSYSSGYSNGYSNGSYYNTGQTIHSDPAQAVRAEMQAGQIAKQIPPLEWERANVEAQIGSIRNSSP